VKELHDIIVRVAEILTNEVGVTTSRETEYRLNACRATNGTRIEI